jgi:nitrate reductase assembly molybdenum cofactor insertion protein NarJ
MDGAVNMNPSNAPHVLSSSEAKKIEKSVAKETAADEKHIAQVVKTLKSAEKDESKAEKVRVFFKPRRCRPISSQCVLTRSGLAGR